MPLKDLIKRGVDPYADADATAALFNQLAGNVTLPFSIDQTSLITPTSVEVISPIDGTITGMTVIVTAAVTVGGAVTANVGAGAGTAVAGLSVTIASAATKGTVVSDTPTAGTATAVVKKGDRIQIIPSAAFDTAGALAGYLSITAKGFDLPA
jgi:hypothetical protein